MPSFLGLEYTIPASMNFDDRVQVTNSLNLRQTAIKRPGHRYRMSVRLRPSADGADNAFGKLSAHKQYHSYNRQFDVPVIQPPDQPDIDALADTAVTAGASVNEFRVPASFATLTRALGRYITFANRIKVYKIVQVNEVTGDNTVADVVLDPPIAPADFPTGSTITMQFNNVTMRVRYDPEFDLSETIVAGENTFGEIQVVEAV